MSTVNDRPLSSDDEAVINAIYSFDLGHQEYAHDAGAAMTAVAPELRAAWDAFSAAQG
jgi:hypothetical protein